MVMETILPDIRRHGAYITPELMAKLEGSPELSSQLAQMLKEEKGRCVGLEKQIELMVAKSDYFDKLVATDTLTNIRQTAKALHIPEKLFTYLLFTPVERLYLSRKIASVYFKCIENLIE